MSGKWIYLPFMIFLLLFSLFCERVTAPVSQQQVRKLTPEEGKIVSADNDFGIKLFREIAKQQEGENIFVSPLSVSMALGMALNGAEGTTREAMENTLELNGLSQQQINGAYQSLIRLLTGLDPQVVFRIANAIWYRNTMTFEADFIAENQKYFNARVQGIDFNAPASVDLINNWVKDNTNGKISKIVDAISPSDVMFLINAIYFKGDWTYEFKKELTTDDKFIKADGSQINCRMMRQENKFLYLETGDFQAVDLPYGNGDFRLTLFLPQPDVDPEAFVAGITGQQFSQWLGSFSVQDGLLEMPKFRLEYKLLMNDVLKALGMDIAFEPYQANFQGMYQGMPNVFISSVLHKTYVKLDEEGTEAAAVTSITMGATSVGGPGGFHLRADRPFFFVIREKHSNTLLFIGLVAEPEWEES